MILSLQCCVIMFSPKCLKSTCDTLICFYEFYFQRKCPSVSFPRSTTRPFTVPMTPPSSTGSEMFPWGLSSSRMFPPGFPGATSRPPRWARLCPERTGGQSIFLFISVPDIEIFASRWSHKYCLPKYCGITPFVQVNKII